MPTLVQCATCAAKLNVPDEMVGKQGRCPKCKNVTVLSPAGNAPEPSPTGASGPVKIQCPECAAAMNVPAELIGKRGKCPNCGNVILFAGPETGQAGAAPQQEASVPITSTRGSMEFSIEGNPDYGQLTVNLGPGDVFIAEGGAMTWMSGGMELRSRLLGGIFRAFFRKLFGGESLFVGQFTHETGGSVTISPGLPGSVLQRTINGDTFVLTKGCFLGCTEGVNLKTRFGGLKSLFSGEGSFFIECSGDGEVFYNSFGGVIEKDVDGELTVDTGHVVAWESGLSYTIGGMGSLKSTLLSGEGLVMKFSGTGKIYVQTRTLGGLSGWLTPFCRG